ncbi:MAG: nucleotide exchange factor GrpE [Nitrosopumilaceae archaeon]|nr:nucleotide exchange factor GrpE [Nitrosopumilaceae archaeon]
MTKTETPEDPTPGSGGSPGVETEAPNGASGPSSKREGGHEDNLGGGTGLEADLEAERRRSQDYEAKYKRALADYANLERRTTTAIQNGINSERDSLLRDFLEIHDDFVRARDAYHSGGSETAGLDSIIRNVDTMLKRWGVETIKAAECTFDPRLHEAMLTKTEPDLEEQTVTRELRKGYITHGRVIRPALVEISTKGGAE